MSSLWFLKIALKCLDHFAWPLLALGYPLCASVQAIETDSYKETKNLISYWILLSLICLFEYAFSRLLQWFQFWYYIKLMIIFWLIIPDFGRASYTYNNLIRTCMSFKPQAIICRLKKWRKFFAKFIVKEDDFLQHVERYVKENGTETLEKLIARKNTNLLKNTTSKPVPEATNAIRDIDNKEMQQTNEKKVQTEHKAIKDVEVIEKKEISAGKHDNPVMPNLASSQNASAAMVETKGGAGEERVSGEVPESCTHKEVQNEWTCALCHLTTTSEKTLNSHLQGRKHRANEEALKAKNQPVQQKLKSDQSKEELKQKNNEQKKPHKPAATNHSKFICEVCNVYCPCEITLQSHKIGKKHLAKIKTLI
ncbi:hypothetical protein VNO78_11590 [Psophocarpus tetragonolobus]|uniref:HVA22-like protein n=1 Tax=Psophocarpus tetragonolobus TaxID=3891 RepID=A0AAN9SU06_PSOTE